MEPADGGRFVEDLQTRLSAAFRLPASASLVDILAVFSGARCFIGDSESGHLAALGFGVPSLFLAPGPLPPALDTLGEAAPPAAPPADTRDAVARLLETPRTNGLPESVAGRLEKHFDALAGFADAALAGRFDRDATARTRQGVALMRSLQDADLRVDAMRRAWETRSEQVAALRIEMADLQIELAEKLEAMEKDLKGDLSRTEQHLAEAQAEGRLLAGRLAEAQAEVRLLAGRLAEAQAEGRLLSGRLVALQADADRQMAERDAQIAQSLGELEAMRAEFLRLTNLRLFRYTAPFRGLYAALRRNLGRG
jgi:hypothetical protein